MEGFADFLEKWLEKDQKFYCNFRGIKRRDYPRWQGWSYIDSLKGTTHVSEIDDEFINILVENMFLVRFLTLKFFTNESTD